MCVCVYREGNPLLSELHYSLEREEQDNGDDETDDGDTQTHFGCDVQRLVHTLVGGGRGTNYCMITGVPCRGCGHSREVLLGS